jgi:BirA family biotin operon repressor/biotin-[acetyl-CoA-carboxylase] ligase
VVVGIGINVNWPASDEELPTELRGAAVSLRQLRGHEVDREALLDAVLTALGSRTAALSSVSRRARLAEDFRCRCTTVGATVRVDLADESFVGTAVSVTDDGHLVVDVHGTLRTVVAGDVVHLRPDD